jgi:hypothetical protein
VLGSTHTSGEMTPSPLDLASIDEAVPNTSFKSALLLLLADLHPVLDDFDPAAQDVLLKLGAEFQEVSILLFGAKAHHAFLQSSACSRFISFSNCLRFSFPSWSSFFAIESQPLYLRFSADCSSLGCYRVHIEAELSWVGISSKRVVTTSFVISVESP